MESASSEYADSATPSTPLELRRSRSALRSSSNNITPASSSSSTETSTPSSDPALSPYVPTPWKPFSSTFDQLLASAVTASMPLPTAPMLASSFFFPQTFVDPSVLAYACSFASNPFFFNNPALFGYGVNFAEAANAAILHNMESLHEESDQAEAGSPPSHSLSSNVGGSSTSSTPHWNESCEDIGLNSTSSPCMSPSFNRRLNNNACVNSNSSCASESSEDSSISPQVMTFTLEL